MTFSPEWNDVYSRGEQNVQWPWSDLISLVMRYGCTKGKVLELGCGMGGNLKLFKKLGMKYFGTDCAPETIPKKIPTGTRRYHGDFTVDLPKAMGGFDLICDRAAVTHNDTESIRNALKLAYDALKPGGYYIGVDWFSTKHTDFRTYPHKIVDAFTNTDYQSGQFKGVGKVHFSNKQHLQDLFIDFEILQLSEKVITTEGQPTFASWNIVARRTE